MTLPFLPVPAVRAALGAAVLLLGLSAAPVRAEDEAAAKPAKPEAAAAGETPAKTGEEPAAAADKPADKTPGTEAAPAPAETSPEKAAPAANPVPDAKPAVKANPPTTLGRVGYILMHTFMGGMVALAAVEVILMLVAAPIMYVLPTSTPLEPLFPERWRRAVALGMLGGVVPGLALVAGLGVVATAVSAVRNIGMFTGE